MQYNPEYESRQSQPGQQGQPNPAMMQGTQGQRVSVTNTPDPQYDLISAIYHALGGAQVCEQYAADAGQIGDQELAQFFLQTQQNQIACAEKAKQLLGRRLGQVPLH